MKSKSQVEKEKKNETCNKVTVIGAGDLGIACILAIAAKVCDNSLMLLVNILVMVSKLALGPRYIKIVTISIYMHDVALLFDIFSSLKYLGGEKFFKLSICKSLLSDSQLLENIKD